MAFEATRPADTAAWQIFPFDPDGVRVELCFGLEPLPPSQSALALNPNLD